MLITIFSHFFTFIVASFSKPQYVTNSLISSVSSRAQHGWRSLENGVPRWQENAILELFFVGLYKKNKAEFDP